MLKDCNCEVWCTLSVATGDIEVKQGGGQGRCGVARCLGGAAEIGWQTKRVWVLQRKKSLQITLPEEIAESLL